jgi:hypothetical protein
MRYRVYNLQSAATCCGKKPAFPSCSEVPEKGNTFGPVDAACADKPTCDFVVCRCPADNPGLTCGSEKCFKDPYQGCTKDFEIVYGCGSPPLLLHASYGWPTTLLICVCAAAYLGWGKVVRGGSFVELVELRGLVRDGLSLVSSGGASTRANRGAAGREAAAVDVPGGAAGSGGGVGTKKGNDDKVVNKKRAGSGGSGGGGRKSKSGKRSGKGDRAPHEKLSPPKAAGGAVPAAAVAVAPAEQRSVGYRGDEWMVPKLVLSAGARETGVKIQM